MERCPADTPGIEEVHFIKQLGAFNKELTVFIKTDFKRRQVKDLVVRLNLAKIRYEGHIQGECFGNTHFYIHATADVFTPRGRWSCGLVVVIFSISRHERVSAQPHGRLDVHDAFQYARLGEKLIKGRVDGVPIGLFAHTADLPHKVDVPVLFFLAGKAQGGIRNTDLGDPAFFGDDSLAFPDSVPVAVTAAVVFDQRIVLDAGGSQSKSIAIQAAAVGVDDDVEPVGIAHMIALRKLLVNTIRHRVKHFSPDVYGDIVVEDFYFRGKRWSAARNRLVLDELPGWGYFLPGRLIQFAIHFDGFINPHSHHFFLDDFVTGWVSSPGYGHRKCL